jgi:psiF repeat
MMWRILAISGLLPILLLAAPASAVTAKDKADTCKIGADAQKLTGGKRKTFIAQCMAQADAAPKSTGKEPPSKLTHKQKLETCNFGADDQKLTGNERKIFLAKCMGNAPRKKAAAPAKPLQVAPPPKPQ